MLMRRSTPSILLFLTLSWQIFADDPCRHEYPDKGVIDISSLARTDGKAAFPDETPTTGQNYKYSYNPCKPFSEEDPCTNVAACQVSMDGQYRFALANQDSTTWKLDDAPEPNPLITYSLGPKQVTVYLQCSDSTTPLFTAVGEVSTNAYVFRLSHKCACWNGCKNSPKPSGGGGGGGLSGGAVFLIILVAVLVIYFVFFAIFYRVRYQKTGADLIAHRGFWVAIPGYAKDGVFFIFRRASGKGVYQPV